MEDIREFELKKSILVFFDKCKVLESIEASCSSLSTPQMFYEFVIDVNVMSLLDEDGELCTFILKEPVKARMLFREVIHTAINTLKWLPTVENVAQLMVTIKVTSLPAFPEKGTCYLCPDPACSGASGLDFLRVQVPGTREKHTIRNDRKCVFCESILKENVKARVLSERLVADMVPIESFSGIGSFGRHQAIPVYFKGSLIEEVRLGAGYSVVGLTAGVSCLPTSYEERIHLEADHGWPITFQPYEIKEGPSEFLGRFRGKIENKLRESGLDDAATSPYILPLVLSYYFGENIVSKGLFHKLKLGILLALATCGRAAVAKDNVSLLAVGRDTSIVDRLLTYGRSLAPRSTTVMDQQQLKVSVSRDNESGCLRVEANPVLLASGGVCYLGNVDKFNVAAQRTVARILETNCVEVEIPRDNSSRGSSFRSPPKEYPTESQVWAYASRSSRKQSGAARTFQNSGVADVTKLLLDVFSIVYYTDSWSAFDNDQKDAFAMLGTLAGAMGEDGPSLYSHEELQMFLRIVRRRNVRFETDAEELIKGYYVASRRLRNSGKNCTEIAITAVASLSSLAEAHARLSLRCNVIVEDAIAAIFSYEEYLTSRFGSSCFTVQPFPHILQNGECEDLKMVLEQYASFASHLVNLVAAYGKDVQSEMTSEE